MEGSSELTVTLIYIIYIYLCYIIISIRASFYNLIWSMQITNEMKFYESMINARKKNITHSKINKIPKSHDVLSIF